MIRYVIYNQKYYAFKVKHQNVTFRMVFLYSFFSGIQPGKENKMNIWSWLFFGRRVKYVRSYIKFLFFLSLQVNSSDWL